MNLQKISMNKVNSQSYRDNPFVDSIFINKLVKIYTLHNLKYLSAHDNIKNLPYGLQAEIFKIKYLRESVSNKKNVTEHVTTEIRKNILINI